MKYQYLLAAAGLCGLLTAAIPFADPSTPVQSLQLSKTEKLDGTLTLPNENTLLFLPNGEKHDVRVLALSTTGQKLWESSIVKTHHSLGTINVWKRAAGGDMEARSLIQPLQLYSAGNHVLTAEFIGRDNSMRLKEGLLVVQRIDENGRVVRHDFEQPEPGARSERTVVGSYADADALYVVAKHSNARQETVAHFLERYDPVSKTSQQVALPLPAPYEARDERTSYPGWIMAGRRGGKTYFYRAVQGKSKKDNPMKFPVEFEFRLFDNAAQPVGEFTTQLHQQMQPMTFINCSGRYAHAPSQGHAPEIITIRTQRSTTIYDTYDVTASGLAEVYLDPASEDVYLLGEYASTRNNPRAQPFLLGTYIFRLKPDGSVAAMAQSPYPADVAKDSKFLRNSLFDSRRVFLFVSPATHELLLNIDQNKRNFLTTYGPDAKLVSQRSAVDMSKGEPIHNLWLIGSSYAEADNLGFPQVELPRQYLTAYPQLKALVERTSSPTKAKVEEVPQYSFRPLPDGQVLVVRTFPKVGSKVEVFVL